MTSTDPCMQPGGSQDPGPSPSTPAGSPYPLEPAKLAPFAVKSYRYLRLAIVVVVAALMVSVAIERTHVSCWQGSISAYYYTPVHTMFLGALIVIGVCLIAIKGSTDVEDVLLNVAGVLAPVVAFVPTSLPSDSCTSAGFASGDAEAAIDNNLVAFAIGGAIALAIAYGVARAKGTMPARPKVDSRTRVALGLTLVFLIVGVVWYFGWRESFLDRAHGGAAVAMFALVGVVMFLNARSAPRPYNRWYAVTVGAMVAAAIAVLIGKWLDRDWRHQILWLEIFELLPFVVYWTVQTIEHWAGGVPTGDERDKRAEEAHVMAGAA